MNEQLGSELEPLKPDEAIELLQDLESQSIEKILRLRSHERFEARIRVTLRSGNSSDHGALELSGITGDISRGGCRVTFPQPLLVGNIYRLEFDREEIDLPLIFARCLRCRLIREDAFEAGFSFFTSITLPNDGEGETTLS